MVWSSSERRGRAECRLDEGERAIGLVEVRVQHRHEVALPHDP